LEAATRRNGNISGQPLNDRGNVLWARSERRQRDLMSEPSQQVAAKLSIARRRKGWRRRGNQASCDPEASARARASLAVAKDTREPALHNSRKVADVFEVHGAGSSAEQSRLRPENLQLLGRA
jgi:hypothetical protein